MTQNETAVQGNPNKVSSDLLNQLLRQQDGGSMNQMNSTLQMMQMRNSLGSNGIGGKSAMEQLMMMQMLSGMIGKK